MQLQKLFSYKATLVALSIGLLITTGSARADDEYDLFDALVPFIIYQAITEPRVVVRKRYYTEGRLIPRYSREYSREYSRDYDDYPRHRRHSRSRGHYRYPHHGRHHNHF